ncbi:MAG: H-NS histone family protein [bacterium]|nr:H-NS histone family protein [bacterium]
MAIDLDSLSIPELRTLIADAQEKISEKNETTKRELLEEMEKLAEQRGVDLAAVIALRKGKGRKSIIPPKYQNSNDPTQSWSGRGRKPKWVKEHLEGGGDLEDLAIK